jgi:hypothetical protein
VPDIDRWSSNDKDALREIIIAKVGRTELRYMWLLKKHTRLRTAILKLRS